MPGQRVLRAVCAVGVAASLVENVELSLDAGIGGFLHRHGRILRRDGPEAQAEPATLREFELLGAQFAIPIVVCPTGARVFGDLNDPNSEVTRLLENNVAYRLRDELGTGPLVYYIAADPAKMED